jgi:hypothetical protein
MSSEPAVFTSFIHVFHLLPAELIESAFVSNLTVFNEQAYGMEIEHEVFSIVFTSHQTRPLKRLFSGPGSIASNGFGLFHYYYIFGLRMRKNCCQHRIYRHRGPVPTFLLTFCIRKTSQISTFLYIDKSLIST